MSFGEQLQGPTGAITTREELNDSRKKEKKLLKEDYLSSEDMTEQKMHDEVQNISMKIQKPKKRYSTQMSHQSSDKYNQASPQISSKKASGGLNLPSVGESNYKSSESQPKVYNSLKEFMDVNRGTPADQYGAQN